MHPELFHFHALTIYAYGVMVSIAILVGGYLAVSEAKRKGINREAVVDFILVASVVGIVGARLVYVLLELDSYLAAPLTIFAFSDGGLSFHGAVLGGLIAGIWFVRNRGISFGRLADVFSPSLAISYAIGRIGCFLNGCCYGIPTDLPWATLTRYAPGLRHPTQLYASLANVLIFAVLWRLRKHRKFDGYLFLLYVSLYSLYRFINDFFRENFGHSGFPSLTQISSIAIILLSVVLISFFTTQTNKSAYLCDEDKLTLL